MASLHKTAVIASLLAITAGAEMLDSQIERFILEKDYLLLKDSSLKYARAASV